MIKIKDGVAIGQEYNRFYAHWVDCPKDGPVPPKLSSGLLLRPTDRAAEWAHAFCSVCGEEEPHRRNRIPEKLSGKGGCPGSCQNGRAAGGYCSCKCRGKCHGQGLCWC